MAAERPEGRQPDAQFDPLVLPCARRPGAGEARLPAAILITRTENREPRTKSLVAVLGSRFSVLSFGEPEPHSSRYYSHPCPQAPSLPPVGQDHARGVVA